MKRSLTPLDPREVFRLALRWDLSSELLRDDALAMARVYGSGHDDHVLTPHLTAATIYAFALELYLKCIVLLDRPEIRFGRKDEPGHDLISLYETWLTPARRKQIEAVEKRVLNVRKRQGRVPYILKGAKTLFIGWRYCFEPEEQGGFDDLERLAANVLRRTILEIRPDFEAVYDVARRARMHRADAILDELRSGWDYEQRRY